ncbi:HNH endonuclease [Stenomitos frigidus]|uniref:HNH endonuclease n=1 Tax=Stenomitos frigidus TaxID=1886765 RepID=UPI0011B1CA71|nr:HNH endonuclease [Stenomitos frigidus]
MPINDAIKQAIRERASYLCEYCHSPERLSANRFTVDHIIIHSGHYTHWSSNLRPS